MVDNKENYKFDLGVKGLNVFFEFNSNCNMAFATEDDTSNVKTCFANFQTGFLHMF